MLSAKPKAFNAIELAAYAALAMLAVFYLLAAGPLSRHMILHIALMTGLAPLIASAARKRWHASSNSLMLLLATAVQLLAFFIWHSPQAMTLAMHSLLGGILMQLTLLAAAVWFWWCIMNWRSQNIWPAVGALMVTGKLFCLVAVLLVFAPRLFAGAVHMGHSGAGLADQQLAGLLMIAACPLAYVATALVLISRWLRRLDPVGPAYHH